MKMNRFYLTVVREVESYQEDLTKPGYARRSALIRGRFRIALVIMPRFEIYGQTKPSRTYRPLFIVTENYLLQSPFSPSLSLSLPSSAARVSALLTHSSKTTTRDMGLQLRTSTRYNLVQCQL